MMIDAPVNVQSQPPTQTPMPTRVEKLTVAEFVRLYDELGGIELINGEIIKLSPTFFLHGYVIRFLFRVLDEFVQEHLLGEVFSEMTFILPENDNSNWVQGSRQPDIMFVSRERFDAFLARRNTAEADPTIPFSGIPDLVVEVISPSDRFTDINRKVNAYLKDGVRMIWLVDLEAKVITVYEADKPFVTLTVSDTLTGGDVLPGFTLAVNEVFKV